MELVCRPSRRAVSSVLADTSVCPGLFLQLSVCVHLCVISSALSVPVRSLQKSLGLVIPLLATLHNICHDSHQRSCNICQSLSLCFLTHTHTHTLRFLFSLLSLLLSFFSSFLTYFLHTNQKYQTVLMSYPLTRHWSTGNIRLLLSEQ